MKSNELSKYVEEDFEVIKQKAEAGDPYYQGVLGEIYFHGEQCEEDGLKAINWATLSAQQGHPLGFYFLGILCLLGAELPINIECQALFSRAFPGLLELAEKGDVRAQTALASSYRSGLGTAQDIDKSMIWYNEAVKKGFPRAMYILGVIYYEGLGVEKNYEKARDWFQRLAEKGDNRARYRLANMQFGGHGVRKNIRGAMKVFRELQTSNRVYEIIEKDDDFIIPNTFPPKYKLEIEEGSCGECCLWTILWAKGINTTLAEINKAGSPGRGLRSNEIVIALNKYSLDFVELTRTLNTSNPDLTLKRYRSFMYDDIITALKKRNPVLLGVKRYPTQTQEWACDHLLLLVGYNEKRDEVIFNDFDKRARLYSERFFSATGHGYSLLNKYNWVFAVEFSNFPSP